MNLAGDVEGLLRGEVLARPGTLRPTSMIDAEVSLLAGARALADGARVRVHAASAEVLARVRLLGGESLEPGRSGLAQLRLEGPAVVGRGDRLVLRSYSPAETIGGALVLDPLAPRRRAAERPAVERLREAATPAQAAEAMVAEAGPAGIEAPAPGGAPDGPAPRAGLGALREPGARLAGAGPRRRRLPGAPSRLGAAALEALAAFHRAQPLKAGMPREELRARAFGQASPSPSSECSPTSRRPGA